MILDAAETVSRSRQRRHVPPWRPTIISLTYLSTAVVRFNENQLTELLATSRKNNRAAGLTGMLLYADGHFIQTLEGPQDAVNDTVARIRADTRHRDIYPVLQEDIQTRAFGEWSMGFETLSKDEAANLPGFNNYLDGNPISDEQSKRLGHAEIFHRVFRDNMR